MKLKALLELLSNRPLLTRKDLAQRYGITLRGVDKRRAAGRLPKPVYLKNCLQPLWRPCEIIQHEQYEAGKRRIKKVNQYPCNWPEIAKRIKDAAKWRCVRCHHPHCVKSGHVLTVHHLDGNKANCESWNLAALCQRCHLKIQARVKMGQLFFPEVLPVSEWFKPHLKGYLKSLKL